MTKLFSDDILNLQALKRRKSWLVPAKIFQEVQRWTLWTVIIQIFIVSTIVEIIPGRNVISLNIRGVKIMKAVANTVRWTVSQFL